MNRVYIGYDKREHAAYEVAEATLCEKSSAPVVVTPLCLDRLESQGLMTRPYWVKGNRKWDVKSGAWMSTEFSNTRFLVPLLAQTGWALFVDCDVVFLDDVQKLFDLADPEFAVMCVKHPQKDSGKTKMDGQAQQPYARKNWTSVMLFNCDHDANHHLTINQINGIPGRDLHAMCWLDDSLIGELPNRWNWLVNINEKPEDPAIAHFTRGGPWLPAWPGAENDAIWNKARARHGL